VLHNKKSTPKNTDLCEKNNFHDRDYDFETLHKNFINIYNNQENEKTTNLFQFEEPQSRQSQSPSKTLDFSSEGTVTCSGRRVTIHQLRTFFNSFIAMELRTP